MNKNKRFWLWGIIAVFFLSACGADIEQSVTLYRNEAWEADSSFTMSAEALALVSSPEEIERELATAVTGAKEQGVNASWKSSRDGDNVTYTIHSAGEGLELLGDTVFDNRNGFHVIEDNGQRQISFSHSAGSNFLGANKYTLTLHGGEIISSNGIALDNGSVRWINPSSRMEAVLTEKGRFGLGAFLLVVVLAGVIGGGGWYFWQQRQTRTAFCPHCGAQMNPQAQFCPQCGQQR